jgi:hypothetical protein
MVARGLERSDLEAYAGLNRWRYKAYRNIKCGDVLVAQAQAF